MKIEKKKSGAWDEGNENTGSGNILKYLLFPLSFFPGESFSVSHNTFLFLLEQ